MSLYTLHLSECLAEALSRVPQAQPAQVAGYWANRDFWIAEFKHLLLVSEGYPERLKRMQSAYYHWSRRLGGEFNRDDCWQPRQQAIDSSSPQGRRKAVSLARSALNALADRSLDLGIATYDEYDRFIQGLRITKR